MLLDKVRLSKSVASAQRMSRLWPVLVTGMLSFVVVADAFGQALFVPGGGVGTSGNANVGVGTTSPSLKLEVANAGYPYNLFLSGVGPSLYFGPTSGTFPNGSGNLMAGFLGLSTSTGSYGQGQGDLNIATQSRGAGNSSAINFLLPADDSGNYYLGARFTRSGYFGIGTSNPTARLSVRGDVKIGDSSEPRGFSLLQNYMSLGETESGATTILGNNIKVTNEVNSTLEVSTNPTDGSNWLGIGYYHGFTFNHVGPNPVGTRVNEHTGELVRIATNGNVGIGTTNPTHKLSVNGTIKAKEVIVETTGWSDCVFADDYRLAPLNEVEAHIKAEKRLPGIPSELQVAEQGVSVGEMQAALLAKIEELTLHVISLEKVNSEQSMEIAKLRAAVLLKQGARN